MPPALTDETVDALRPQLEQRLKEFNEQHAGPIRPAHVASAVRDASGRLIAGLTGEIFWNALYVHTIWVESEHRGKGHGRALLEHAERAARDRGCDVSYLSTFDFQAPGFYAALGYEICGELPGVPKGRKRIWFWKRL